MAIALWFPRLTGTAATWASASQANALAGSATATATAAASLSNVTIGVISGNAVAQAVGAKWGATAPTLTGSVTPGLYRTDDGLWWVIQAYNTAVYPDPTLIPALIRRARVPGERAPWVQPLDQFDAYKLVNAFTGAADECTHNGAAWRVTQADGAGNNVWTPGQYGWAQV
jgi:hypothetical protein